MNKRILNGSFKGKSGSLAEQRIEARKQKLLAEAVAPAVETKGAENKGKSKGKEKGDKSGGKYNADQYKGKKGDKGKYGEKGGKHKGKGGKKGDKSAKGTDSEGETERKGKSKTKCLDWANGSCTRGDSCFFAHDENAQNPGKEKIEEWQIKNAEKQAAAKAGAKGGKEK